MNQDPKLEALRTRLSRGEFGNLAEIRDWIREQSSSNTPNPDDHGRDVGPDGSVSAIGVGCENIMRFVDSLRHTVDLVDWVDGVRAGMKLLIPEIDRVSISLNRLCSFDHPDIPVTQVISESPLVPSSLRIDRTSDMSHAERFLHNLRSTGFPVDSFHPPCETTLLYRGTAYLGVILFWKERHKRPVTSTTMRTIERLRPLFELACFHYVALCQLKEPARSGTNRNYRVFVHSVRLSTQERAVTALLVAGQTYGQIAEILNISINTVRSHIKAIYAKAGVESQIELIAKYFPPQAETPSKASE